LKLPFFYFRSRESETFSEKLEEEKGRASDPSKMAICA
jgi:hypothetical protein